MITIDKQLLSLNQDIAGQEIGIPVYQLSCADNKLSKTVYIQSAVHAAEMQGSAVILKLIKQLQQCQLKANFVLVPNCNPFGRTQRAGEYLQGRFDATNGNNWNRFYHYEEQQVIQFFESLDLNTIRQEQSLLRAKPELQGALGPFEQDIVSQFRQFMTKSLAQKLNSPWGVNTAQFLNTRLQTLSTQADLVLDLHTGPSSTRHLYSPNFLVEKSKWFNIENVIAIPESFAGALDEASFTPFVKLAALFKEQGIAFNYRTEAYTIELGSQENICLEQAELDAAGILNYLQHFGWIDRFSEIDCEKPVVTPLVKYKTLYSEYAGMAEYVVKPGDYVVKGQVLARILNSLEFDSDLAITEIYAPVNGTIILHYPSAAVQVGTQLFKIAQA